MQLRAIHALSADPPSPDIGYGALADRVGRKPLLVVATLIIGVFTLVTAYGPSRETLLFRFLAGIGLGGATPCFIALTSEYALARHRAALVTLMWAGFPIGAMLGAFTNSLLIPVFLKVLRPQSACCDVSAS